MGGSTRGRREDVDALAAALDLPPFLDSRRERESSPDRSSQGSSA